MNARNSKFSAVLLGAWSSTARAVLTQTQISMFKTFVCALPQAVAARSSTVRSTKMHCSATAAKPMYATSTCAHTVKSQLVVNALKMVSVRTADKMTSACSKVLVVCCSTQD